MATKLHNQMTGADLHPNAIDGTTGTELTAASQTTYDSRWPKGKVYAATTTSTVTNTTVDTAFSQSYTLPANTLTVGKMIRVTSRGVYSTAATSSGQITFTVKPNSTTVLVGACSPGDARSNKGFNSQGEIVCVATGSGGSVEAQGWQTISSSNTGTFNMDLENASAITVDTTVTQVLTVSVQWSAASASNIATQRIFIVEVFG